VPTSLPLWYGRERGTSLASLVTFDEENGEDDGFFGRLGNRLFGGVTDLHGGVVGCFVPLLALIAATAAVTPASTALAAFLALGALLWGVGCAAAAWCVWRDGDDAPAWANGTVVVVVALGRLLIIAAIIGSIVAVAWALMVVLVGVSSSER
jgi:hypothetical protein